MIPQAQAKPKTNSSAAFVIKILASGLGTGYSPVASGTVGSLLAAAIWWYLPESLALKLALTALVLVISVPVSTAAEKLYGHKDDSRIVIDEVAGMWLALLFFPVDIKHVAAAFFLFRLFDVIKPLGINKIQSLPGGWGIVVDDALAGILANIVLRTALYLGAML